MAAKVFNNRSETLLFGTVDAASVRMSFCFCDGRRSLLSLSFTAFLLTLYLPGLISLFVAPQHRETLEEVGQPTD